MFPAGDTLSMKHPLMRSASVAVCNHGDSLPDPTSRQIQLASDTGMSHTAHSCLSPTVLYKLMQEKIQKTLRSSRTIVCTADLAYGCSVGLLCASAGSAPNLPPLNSKKE